jgi:hypothetical protein
MMKKLTATQRAELFKEWREDEAAAKREDAHGTAEQRKAWREYLEEKLKTPAADTAKDRGNENSKASVPDKAKAKHKNMEM